MSQGYRVEYLPRTERFFKKHPTNLCSQIVKRLELVAQNPFASNNNIVQLRDPISGYRLRVGDYRAIYILDKDSGRLIVVKIDHRSSVYKP